MAVMRGLRSVLDFIYQAAGVLAALSLIAILLLIVVQMLARWTGEVFPGAPEYAGYAMAAASFLAFANALNLQTDEHFGVRLVDRFVREIFDHHVVDPGCDCPLKLLPQRSGVGN